MGSPRRFDAIVIGAGVNGLTAAILLAKLGKRVLVVERADAPGGMHRTREFAPGFRTAPLAPDAGWLAPAVLRATGIRPPEWTAPDLPLALVGPAEALAIPRDPSPAAETLRKHSARDAGRWPDFAGLVHKLSGFLGGLYRFPPPDIGASRPAEVLPLLAVARELRSMGRRDMIELLRTVPMAVEELLEDWFESPVLRAAIGACGVSGIGQGPRSGGTAFVLLHRQVGAPRGCFGPGGGGYWKEGPDALVNALLARTRELGIEVRLSAEVEQITVQEDRVTGVVLGNGDSLAAPLVLSSADPSRTMLSMLDPRWLDPELLLALRNIKYRGCTSRVTFALEQKPRFAGLDPRTPLDGVITLTGSLEALERAADAAKYGTVSEPPFIMFRLLSDRWPGLAPAGRHVLSAEVQWTPWRLREGGWDRERRQALEREVVRAIEAVSPGFGDRILAAETLAPPDLEERYGLTEGAASHGELMLDQILFMRPLPALARYAGPLGGLVLGGSGQHPGPGIAGMPGYLAVRAATRRQEGRRMGPASA